MGASSSGILSEIFLQYIEALHIAHLTQKHKIINYFLYVDYILFVFDSSHTNIQAIFTDFNSIHPNLHFTAEAEQNNTIHYLDIFIQKTSHSIRITIYRKPAFTYTIIPYSSNHSTQHKYAVHYTHASYIRKNIIGGKKSSINPIQHFLPNPTTENSKIQTKPDKKLTNRNTRTKNGLHLPILARKLQHH
jgi:hypothetical protein